MGTYSENHYLEVASSQTTAKKKQDNIMESMTYRVEPSKRLSWRLCTKAELPKSDD